MHFCDEDNFCCAYPFWAYDMSKWSWWHVLCFVPLCHACLSPSRCLNLHDKSDIWYKLLLLVVWMLCLRCDNLMHVYPNKANDMSKCSSWDALHVGCYSMLVWVHLDALISVARVLLVINCCYLLFCCHVCDMITWCMFIQMMQMICQNVHYEV